MLQHIEGTINLIEFTERFKIDEYCIKYLIDP